MPKRQNQSGQSSGSDPRRGQPNPGDHRHNQGHEQPAHQQPVLSRIQQLDEPFSQQGVPPHQWAGSPYQGVGLQPQEPRPTEAERCARDAETRAMQPISPYATRLPQSGLASVQNRQSSNPTNAFDMSGFTATMPPREDSIPAIAGTGDKQQSGLSKPKGLRPLAPATQSGMSRSTTSTQQATRPEAAAAQGVGVSAGADVGGFEQEDITKLRILKKGHVSWDEVRKILGNRFSTETLNAQWTHVLQNPDEYGAIPRRDWTKDDIEEFHKLAAMNRSDMSVKKMAKKLAREEDDLEEFWEENGNPELMKPRKPGNSRGPRKEGV